MKKSAAAPFVLDGGFISGYVGKQPKWGPIGYVTYKRTYARDIERDEDGLLSVPERIHQLGKSSGLSGTEEFWLTLVRVVEGVYRIQQEHCQRNRLPWNPRKAQASAQEMFTRMWQFKFSPPGRGLWMMGTDYIFRVGGACLNNCAFSSTAEIATDFSAPFCFLMDMSMLGVGVGGDTRGAGLVTFKIPKMGPKHIVGDSREGWVELGRRILDSYVGKDTYPEEIDYSQIRDKGKKIRGFGGISSGPEPLILMVRVITELLNRNVGKKITSEIIVDLANLFGKCVVSGNVRRTAEIEFGDPDDIDFLDLKNPELHPEELASHRWASNNSIFARVGMDYFEAARRTARNGEPGYMWLENARAYSRMGHPPDNKDRRAAGGNPCLEQTLESFELCCLVETYPVNHDSYEDFERTLKFAYLYAKTVTLVPTHDERTNSVLLRNRRIGTSQSGIVQAIEKFGTREYFRMCDRGYDYLEALDRVYSEWLCVPMSLKKTSVKPSGTVSMLPGVTPGMHYPHSKYYFRVIRFASDSPILPALRRAGYRCDEIDPDREPNTTAVYFAIRSEHYSRSKKDVSMWEQLELAAQLQEYWADNQVSVTVHFTKDEAPQIKHALELYETRLKGVSFLPFQTTEEMIAAGYIHPPYQEITKEQYGEYVRGLSRLDLSAGKNEAIEKFCDGESCVI